MEGSSNSAPVPTCPWHSNSELRVTVSWYYIHFVIICKLEAISRQHPSSLGREPWRRGTSRMVCLHSKRSHLTGRRLSRLRSLQGPKESIILDTDHSTLCPPGGGREPGLCFWALRGHPYPRLASTPGLTFLGGHATAFWLPQLELSGPAGETEEYKSGCSHFCWSSLSLLLSWMGNRRSPGCTGARKKGVKDGVEALRLRNLQAQRRPASRPPVAQPSPPAGVLSPRWLRAHCGEGGLRECWRARQAASELPTMGCPAPPIHEALRGLEARWQGHQAPRTVCKMTRRWGDSGRR